MYSSFFIQKRYHRSNNILQDLDQDRDRDADKAAAAAGPKDTGKQAEIAFRLYDKDKDGYITKVW